MATRKITIEFEVSDPSVDGAELVELLQSIVDGTDEGEAMDRLQDVIDDLSHKDTTVKGA